MMGTTQLTEESSRHSAVVAQHASDMQEIELTAEPHVES